MSEKSTALENSLDNSLDNIKEKFRQTEDLYESGIAMMRQNLRRRYPHESEESIEQKLTEWICRPASSPNGDAPGVPGDFSRFDS